MLFYRKAVSPTKMSVILSTVRFLSEQSCLHPLGDADTDGRSSEGDWKEESDLVPKKPSPGRSSSQSVLHRP